MSDEKAAQRGGEVGLARGLVERRLDLLARGRERAVRGAARTAAGPLPAERRARRPSARRPKATAGVSPRPPCSRRGRGCRPPAAGGARRRQLAEGPGEAVEDQHEAAHAERVGHPPQVLAERDRGPVAVARRIGLAEARQVDGDGAAGLAEVRELLRPDSVVAARAVDEEDRDPAASRRRRRRPCPAARRARTGGRRGRTGAGGAVGTPAQASEREQRGRQVAAHVERVARRAAAGKGAKARPDARAAPRK